MFEQNVLLREFLGRVLKNKQENFELVNRELTMIDEDYKYLLTMFEEEDSCSLSTQTIHPSLTSEDQEIVIKESNKKAMVPNDIAQSSSESTVPAIKISIQSRSSSGTEQQVPPVVPLLVRSSSDSSDTSTEFEPKYKGKCIPTFNSIRFGDCENVQDNESTSDSSLESRKKKIDIYFEDLEKVYFDRITRDQFESRDVKTRLTEFKQSLNKFTQYTAIRPMAHLTYARDFASNNIVSSIEFDKDMEFFSIAGVAKKIKIFDYAAVVKDSIGIHYPISEIECTSKISCLSWNSYFKAMMATSDYEGSVIIWDAVPGERLATFQEHEKRCWSVDFNKIDPNLVASGSDDGKVKIWSTNMKPSVATLNGGANICSVKFNPSSLYNLAFGSADHRVYYYDLRNTKTHVKMFKEHQKAVSYVQFLNGNELVSASTDGQIKLWDVDQTNCVRSYEGHVNEKNFVGLTTNDDFIATGSEDNSLYIYYKGIEQNMLTYCFDKQVCSV